jgi:hypothetical protein
LLAAFRNGGATYLGRAPAQRSALQHLAAGQHFSFTCGMNGINYTSLLASVEISENQWFNGVF